VQDYTNGFLKLSEYDLEIHHRPGSKQVNAEVLSRHVTAAVRKYQDPTGNRDEEAETSVYLSRKMIGQAQQEDEFSKQTVHYLKAGENSPYVLDDDSILYYGSPRENIQGKSRIIFPTALREQIIRQHRNPVVAGHQGIKRTQYCLKLLFLADT
jgi:hypothetical protein